MFVARQGTQMEIMIKAKQKHNPQFSFLSLYDPLHPYYRFLLQMIASGRFTPTLAGEEGGGGEGEEREKEKELEKKQTAEEEEEGSDSGDSDDEGFELHPLLRVSTTPRSSPRPSRAKTSATPSRTDSNQTPHPTSIATMSTESSSFFSKSLSSVNAAPSLDHEQGGAWHSVDRACYPHPSLER